MMLFDGGTVGKMTIQKDGGLPCPRLEDRDACALTLLTVKAVHPAGPDRNGDGRLPVMNKVVPAVQLRLHHFQFIPF